MPTISGDKLPLRRVQKTGLVKSFTLIQISILLTVASLVLVTMLPGSQNNLNVDSVSTIKMHAILTALRGYEKTNARLPCPADASLATGSDNYGLEVGSPGPAGNCSTGTTGVNVDSTNHVAIGMVPVRTLGLSNDYALDGYSRTFTYAVDTFATASSWPYNPLPGQITVTDNGAVDHAVVALVSHGADGHEAWVPLSGPAEPPCGLTQALPTRTSLPTPLSIAALSLLRC